MIQMTCLKAFKYAGKMLTVGQGFSVKSKGEARLLAAMKRAQIAVVEAPKPVKIEPVEVPKRAYKRRDMVAEAAPVVVTKASDE